MKVTLSKNAGFCPGVKRADDGLRALMKDGGRIYTLGTLIHNRLYNEALENSGVKSIDFSEIDDILKSSAEEPVTVVIRTHGIPKEQSDHLYRLSCENPGFRVVDMTCPSVKRIHRIAEENTNENTIFLLFCNKTHPEAIGIMSYAKGEKYAISSPEELASIDLTKKVPILCSQTTENLGIFSEIKKNLKKLCTNAILFDTICSVTEKRQSEAVRLATASDLMIVIGGRDSSNTHKLYDLCKRECNNTVWIESASDAVGFPDHAHNIGITAGASTPGDIITEVLNLWKKTKM